MSSLPLRVALFAGGGTLFAGTAYITAIVAAPAPTYSVSDEQRQSRFDVLAPSYETSTRRQEVYLGIGRLRKRMLAEHARGQCLEVGAGTGHNIQLYPADKVTRVVLCDRAPSMVAAMRSKIQKRLGYTPKEADSAFIVSSPSPPPSSTMDVAVVGEHPEYALTVCSAESIPFPDNTFDTVVDVFGLCSFDHPTQALREMSRVCKADGKLILLEHGRGGYSKINWYLDKWAPQHASNWGCWWNRDIRRYLRLSGITTITREERHFGTTVYIVAKPYKPPAANGAVLSSGKAERDIIGG